MTDELRKQYELRFTPLESYRNDVWRILTNEFFQRYVPPDSAVFDLGCGWGEFINHVKCQKRIGMDLNAGAASKLESDIVFLNQDCSRPWPIPDASLDLVFTSNFMEHLPSKDAVKATIRETRRCLKNHGKFVCLGPNIKFLPGSYWDFWDHHIQLTELALAEVLTMHDFAIDECVPRFLPYTMTGRLRSPLIFVKWYLKFPLLWRFFGKQFLVVARKNDALQSPASAAGSG